MPKVLIVATPESAPELGRTVLWRSDIERVFSPEPDLAFEAARTQLPNLVVLEVADVDAALDWIHRLRADDVGRSLPVAVVSRTASRWDQERLRRGGANEVLAGDVDPFVWDARLESLLNVPRRREVRAPVRFGVWSRFSPETEAAQGLVVNLSVRGMLVQPAETLDVGARLDLAFRLPRSTEDLKAVGQVVREAPPFEGRPRYGIEFLILRGDAREHIAAFVKEEGRL